jgi:zinc protease
MKNSELESELSWAQESLINSFIFTFTSSAQVVTRQMLLEYERLQADFLTSYPDKIRAVTVADLYRVAQTYLQPERSVILVVGDGNGFDKPLAKWGPVREVVSDAQN